MAAGPEGPRRSGPRRWRGGLELFARFRPEALAVRRGERLVAHTGADDGQPAPAFRRILVPMKLGIIGQEMAAAAIRLAAEQGAEVEALHVIRVPLEMGIDAAMDEAEQRSAEALAEARALGEGSGVQVIATVTRARSLGRAIVDRAAETGADVILLGSAPRWRRQSRLFSPTVDFVLLQAPCEVLIVAFSQRVLDDELARG
jgi:nucleotide-binding universal stress UspA family protein